ncbi:MAG: alpha/beta fold hydrolase [Betaproteobacteria bacterium]
MNPQTSMATASSTHAPSALTLQAADGYALQALRYPARGPRVGHLLVAGATGVPQRHYRRFAEFAAERGLEVWTLDYRGIGLSKPPSLRGFRMDYRDWARLDLAALVDWVSAYGTEPLYMVGHSYGGHAFGQLPNNHRISRFATFATGAGWSGWMSPGERLRVTIMWRVLGPLIVKAKGYLAWSLLGMGEDLPRDVFYQWRRWCQWPRYFFDDPEQAHLIDAFAQVRCPIRAVNASDDAWAPPASRDAFMSAYSAAPLELITLEPSSLGMRAIGHMGYFRPQASALWGQTLDWLTGPR